MAELGWVIVNTVRGKEDRVAWALAAKGFDAWVPKLATSHRIHRKSARRQVEELPLLSGRLFAAVPVAAEADCASVRYLDGIERDIAATTRRIASHEVALFRATVAQYNSEVRALAAINRGPKGRTRQKWKQLHDALRDLMAGDDGLDATS